MTTMAGAPASTATITATTNNNDVQQWDFASNNHVEEYSQDTVSPILSEYGSRPANGNASAGYEYGFEPLPPSRKKHSVENMSSLKNARSWDRSNRSSDASTKPTWTDDLSAPKRAGTGDKRTTADQPLKHWDDENSKWIHRDKLAKIESRELQAAGIYLPRSRASSKVRKGRSEERHQGTKRTASAAAEDRDHSVPASRHRKNSSAAENSLSDNQAQTPSWDLRLPEEIEAEGDPYWTSTSSRAGSKIPVAKMSPLPIPETFIDRNSPSSRRQSDVPREAESIAYPKTRSRAGSINALAEPAAAGTLQPAKRSATDVSPRKTTPTARKTSAPIKSNGSVSGRPRTRGGPNKDSTSSTGTTRPSTRSGELSPGNRAPEGEPPWMIGSYKPDPRLPPDQQLLPTVARRLQQEKWEKEGKFGSVYDKEFRPMTDDALLSPPVRGPSGAQEEEKQPQEQSDEWPLKPIESKSPTLKQGTSYSTIPKISEKPQVSPLPSPRTPGPVPQSLPTTQQQPARVPDASAENDDVAQKKGGCGCCIIM
ncbi:hypothetical protein BN1708_016830 [Verticillium longisporum]|uniref:TeaA receptor TeaR n=3 Tax=Verticillium longisporum TaxID=100787 RepID=A0A0G4N2H9_VERLO|nr:hypothetical protein BN1708_016830 [Verticillium longisporum]